MSRFREMTFKVLARAARYGSEKTITQMEAVEELYRRGWVFLPGTEDLVQVGLDYRDLPKEMMA